VCTVLPLVLSYLVYHYSTELIPSRLQPEYAPRSKFGVVAVDKAGHGLGTQLRKDGVE